MFAPGIFLGNVEGQFMRHSGFHALGTWTTKSKAVFTGPGFYNPVTDRLTEPNHPGISYSFTEDGHYEEAYYRAISNPTQPACPSAVLQWQHGTYTLEANGSLILKPFEVDGRQVMSSPCSYDESIYTRYKNPEMIERYQVGPDPFHNVQRLDLFRFDGSPMHPMFLAYNPPQMLPTSTLNPTATSTAPARNPTSKSRVKRTVNDEIGETIEPLNEKAILTPTEPFSADRWWWVGVGLTAVGTILYMYPSK
ncbi:hypothetical protein GJ744_002872 [Endocarpon pusillum]|uniref:Protein ROT1 n=1 Tax=Endocarpon pusillum TaxID=364733 RepID=A0A8H7E0Y3_9EURO|nr:hypothetical protein GJ744_002872 [Endocarpon pusillum]